MRDSKINYVVVGAFVLAMLVAGLTSIAMLTGRTGKLDSYYAVFNNVAGVYSGTKVQFEGFPIGQVTEIEPWRDGAALRFKVHVGVQDGWKVPVDSQAQIAASGLLSAVVLDIKGGKAEVFLKPGSRIPSSEAGNLFAVMSNVANEVTDLSQNSLRPLLNNLNTQVSMVGDLLRDHAPQIMANLVAVSGELKDKTPVIARNVQEFSADLNETGDRLNRALSDGNIQVIEDSLVNVRRTTETFAALSGDLRQTERRLDNLLVQLNDVVAGTRGDVEGSLQELRRTLSTISRAVSAISGDLEDTTRNLNEFTRDVRRDPSQLLRGRPASEEQPGRRSR